MDALVLIPVGALVLVASLRFDSAVGRGWRCAGAVGAVICLFLGIRAMLPDETVFFASEVARRVRGQVAEFQKSNARDFLVVEGSSVAAHGCDPKVLREEMAKKGEDACVLQFSAQGANHFERAFLMEAFLRRLAPGERERLGSGRVVVLREVFDAYDRDPLYLFAKDSYTERAKVYMSPEYAWAAWRAFLAGMPSGISEMEKWRRGLEMGGVVLDRLLLNRFAAGALSGMDARARKRRTGAFFPLQGVKEKFDFAAAAAATVEWKDDSVETDGLPPGWLAGREFFHARTKSWVDEEVFFAMPSLESHRRDYQLGFKRSFEGLMVGPPSREDLELFLNKDYWFDGVHPTGAGALLFTKWLAEQLSVDGVVR